MAEETTIHREFHHLGLAVFILLPTSVILLVIAAAIRQPMAGWQIFAAFVALGAMFVCYLGFGIYRMNRIVLTPSKLTVGEEDFTQHDFDLTFGVQPPLVLTPE